MNITDEAVEAAARAMNDYGPWGDLSGSGQQFYLEQARRMIEAAAPHMK